MFAMLEVELHKLQTFINEHGPTYVVQGRSGDSYSRARPEYQQLQDCRHRYAQLLDRLDAQTSHQDRDDFIAL